MLTKVCLDGNGGVLGPGSVCDWVDRRIEAFRSTWAVIGPRWSTDRCPIRLHWSWVDCCWTLAIACFLLPASQSVRLMDRLHWGPVYCYRARSLTLSFLGAALSSRTVPGLSFNFKWTNRYIVEPSTCQNYNKCCNCYVYCAVLCVTGFC